LLLSEGPDARILATAGDKVDYYGGTKSKEKFHGQPDAGATFSDVRDENPGGWIYVSNSEIESNKGGVGALTFDKDGNLLDYQMVLEGTSMNCGGGRTPWNTWVTCEEVEFTGQIYQVHPTGQREAQLMTLGSEGGRWESFAYDDRDCNQPRFFCYRRSQHGHHSTIYIIIGSPNIA
jgi:secreted PhoX family phosphatase